jgi:hypothetical protein
MLDHVEVGDGAAHLPAQALLQDAEFVALFALARAGRSVHGIRFVAGREWPV